MNSFDYSLEVAIIALCTNLGDSSSIVLPLTNIEYNTLAYNIFNSSIKSPDQLIKKIAMLDNYQKLLKLSSELKERIVYLLSPERVIRVYLSLQELKNRNFQIITRASSNYPENLKNTLKDNRPPVLFAIGNLDLLNSKTVLITSSNGINKNDEEFVERVIDKLIINNNSVMCGGNNEISKKIIDYTICNSGNLILILTADMSKIIKESRIIKHLINNKMLILSDQIPNADNSANKDLIANKITYCLSKFSLVVSADDEETYNNAKDAIKNNYSIVFVKNNKTDGLKNLIALGAKNYSSE